MNGIGAVPARPDLLVAAGAMTLLLAGPVDRQPAGVALAVWGLACLAWVAAQRWRGAPVCVPRDAGEWPRDRRPYRAAVLALLAASLALQIVGIAEFPAPLHNDEMSCALAAQEFLGREPPPLFATGWSDCPNLGFYLQSLPLRLAGDRLLGLRLGSALASTLAVFGAFLLVGRYAGRGVALVLLALTVPYHWQLHLGRTGFTYVWATLATVWTLYLLARALESGDGRWFAGAGIAGAVAFQTYYAGRIVLVIAPLWAVALGLADRRRRPALRRGLAIAGLAAGFALLPLALWYAGHPETLLTRTRTVFVFSGAHAAHFDSVLGDHRWQSVADFQLRRIAGFLPLGRDGSLQYGFHGPFLPPVLWLPALAGAALSLARWRRPFHQLYWIWMIGTLVLGGLLTIDPPFSPRLAVISPLVAFLPALALAEGVSWVRRASAEGSAVGRRRARLAPAAAVGALVVWVGLSAVWNLRAYFVDYPLMAPSARRDRIVRLLGAHRDVRTVVNRFDEEEVFGHESYRFLAPGVVGVNAPASAPAGGAELSAGGALALPALWVAPLAAAPALESESPPPPADGRAATSPGAAGEADTTAAFAWWIER